jgi:hypothetical protein
MEEICIKNDYDDRFKTMARSQDSIGWRRFLEGMVCKEIRVIQSSHSSVTGLRCNTAHWGRDLVTRLLEVTHGQWLNPNVQVHDRISGTLATQRKKNCKWKLSTSKSWARKD